MAEIGGDVFDEQIIHYVRKAHGCMIGETTAEIIKKEVGMALPDEGAKPLEIEVRGRNLVSFSIYFLYSLSVVAPITWILPSAKAGFNIFPASIELSCSIPPTIL